MEGAAPGGNMVAPSSLTSSPSHFFSLDAANDLLAAFDIADDPDSRAFLADLLASGTVPPEEVELLSQGSSSTSRRAARRKKGAQPTPRRAAFFLPSSPSPSPNKRARPAGKKEKAYTKDERASGESRGRQRFPAIVQANVSPFFADDASIAASENEDDKRRENTASSSMNTETQSYTPGPEPPWTTAVVVYRRTTVLGGVAEQPPVSLPEAKAVKDRTKSPEAEPYIQPATRLPSPAKIRARTPTKKVKITSRSPSPACFSPISSPSKSTPKRKRETTSYFFTPPPSRNEGRPEDDSSSEESSGSGESSESENGSKDAPSNAAKAPYAATLKESPEKAARPRRGAVSGLPFPPLDAPCFGLVQEQLADDPFWLLIALVFLTRVAGRVSLPVFWGIKALYLTPQALADANPSDLVDTMRHLGMASVRCAAIQRYARGWIARPPLPGVYTTVKNYPLPPEGSLEGCSNGGLPMHSQWEIGHLTQGAYAVDSWRIFCRDALLGRSKHWTGDAGGFMAVKNHSESLAGSSSSSSSDSPNSSDSEPPTDRNTDRAFQPEWMRVLPRDKELRACLRWMWMREGWDWDPLTGERAVLSEDLRCAVDEGRVGYDVHGQLQIFDGDSRPRKKKELVVEL